MPLEWPDLNAAATEYERVLREIAGALRCSTWSTLVLVPTATRRLSCLATRSSM
jgi:hypothetical protein